MTSARTDLAIIAETIRRLAPIVSADEAKALQDAWDRRTPDTPAQVETYFRCRDERRGVK